jgi:membrane protease YdiL (CAAX protease family)
MPGVVVLTAALIPQLAADGEGPAPPGLMFSASIVQSALLLALAVWSGVALAPQVGLKAEVFQAAVRGGSIGVALRAKLLPGMVGGILGGAGLYATGSFASPAALADVEQQFVLPLLARVLYGGVTEELLMRWGLMTALVWLPWRFLQQRKGRPLPRYFWSAILVSALLFGAGHLPAAEALIDELTIQVTLFIVGANAAFGVLFGYLYWQYGLEAAIGAHASAHLVNYCLSAAVT